MASNWLASPSVIDWFKYRLGLPSAPLHYGLTWPVGILTVFQTPVTVPLHSHNGRQMPAVSAVQGDCKRVYSPCMLLHLQPVHSPIYYIWLSKSLANERRCYCSGSLEPESSCHDRDWIMELPMEADILTFTGILTPGDASVASSFPFDITISLSWFLLLSIPPLHSAIP